MIEDSATLDGASAIPLDGVAVGVDHLEGMVVFMLSPEHTYARWSKPGTNVATSNLANVARDAYLAAATASARIDPIAHEQRESAAKPVYPTLLIDDPDHLVIVHRVRSFGIAMVFEREAPIGLARAFAQKIVSTLEHELPYAAEAKPVVVRSAAPYIETIAPVTGPSVRGQSKPPTPATPAPMPAPIAPASPTRAPTPPPPSPHGPTEARTLVSQVSPVLPPRPERISIPPMPLPDVRQADAPEPPPLVSSPPLAASPPAASTPPAAATVPPAIVTSPPAAIAAPPIITTPPVITAAPPEPGNDPYSNGPDTIARPRMAPTAAEIAAVLGEEPAPNSTSARAKRILALVEAESIEPHLVRMRLALRTGLGLEPLSDVRNLNTEAVVLLETAAEDILGVDHDGLVKLLERAVEAGA